MQLQLSLKIADRLHHDLLVRGEALTAAEAARILLGAQATEALSAEVLEVLVRDDRRFCWAAPTKDLLTLHTWQSADPDLSTVPFVALDLETTGAKAGAGKITEVGAVRIEGLRVVKHFETLVNPQRPIPPMIASITGITQSMVADAPRIDEVIPSLLEFLEGAVVVAHNAPFDVGFLNYELHRLRGRILGDGAIDTLPLSRALVPGLENYRLKTVADALGAPVAACHRAAADAQAVAHVFIHLAGVLQSRGITSLSGMREHGRASAPSHSEKLVLTKDLPDCPGTYLFLGEEERVLLAGRADHLANDVRSFFMAGSRRHRGLRTAVRLVERIDWLESLTPLEALVKEQQLLLEHRPPYNPFWTAPEGYVYIKASRGTPGLSLSVTRRAPRWLRDTDYSPASTGRDLIMGPFRRRSAAQAAVAALQTCYPISHCPRKTEARPCERGVLGLCLSPCTTDLEARATHDALVTDLMMWLAGRTPVESLDPLLRSEKAFEPLHTIRRSYEALAAARELCFACLSRPSLPNDQRSVRLNLVRRGQLVTSVSLCRETLESRLGEAASLFRPAVNRIAGGVAPLVAVPQKELDSLLALGRWFQEGAYVGCVLIPLPRDTHEPLEKVQAQVISESLALLNR